MTFLNIKMRGPPMIDCYRTSDRSENWFCLSVCRETLLLLTADLFLYSRVRVLLWSCEAGLSQFNHGLLCLFRAKWPSSL